MLDVARAARRVREDGEAAPGYTVKSLPADERPRERLLKRGPDALSDAELLAIILRTGLVGEMVTELAADVLAQFGGFWGLAGKPVDELTKRRGLKGAKVAQLKAAIEIGKRMAEARPTEERPQVSSPDDAFRLLQFHMTHLEQEEMWVVHLDTKNRLLGRPRSVYRGSLNSTAVRVADLFREAVRENAAGIVIAHNHPSGDPTPSTEDVRVTATIREAGQLLDVELLDHLVIGRTGSPPYVSLKQRGLGFR
jgi:DNA repair protein RadC